MAILLKEITIRYSPQGDNLFQLLKDYYAVFGLWQRIQTGEIVNQRKAELIDDVMYQIGKMIHPRILKRLGELDLHGKEGLGKSIKQFNHAAATENWPDLTAALSDIAKQTATIDRTGELANLWRDAKNTQVSPSIQGLFGGPPKKPEPKWKQFDKPMNARGSLGGTQQDLPMAGGQTDLPLAPGEKLPQMQKNLPPLPTGMTAGGTKQIGGNWEKILNGFGYNWSEEDKAYKNDARNVKIQIFQNNSARAVLPSGKQKDFNNLGSLLRALGHNRKKRHGKEPTAQVAKENYKGLYEFLYT